MSKELVVSANRHETRVAVLEDDQVVEVYYQREKEYSLAGSIHKGRVTRVLPGMQSAFVDIGLDRDAFLYVSDFFEDNDEYDKIVTSVEEKVLKMEKGPAPGGAAPPADLPAPEPSVEAQVVAPVAATAPPAPVPLAAPEQFARRNEEHDRDRRGGRRGRRRRPKGRGLPDSKYFSPGQHTPAVQPPPSPAPEEAEEAEPEMVEAAPEDIVVLPGESLAKYRGEVSGTGVPACPPEPPEPSEAPPVIQEVELESVTAVPEPEPVPPPVEAAGIVAGIVTGIGAAIEEEATTIGEAPVEISEIAETVEFEPAEVESVDAEAAESEEGRSGDQPQTWRSASQTAEDQLGPEPARIPTSLTATLREHGGRYPHRLSRRMRRRGRPDGEPQPVGQEPRPEARPEIRPDVRQAARPEPVRTEKSGAPSISDLLREGQEIIVQIAKEPLGQKGARITSHIALPGRFLVYMPTVDHIGVSRKIPSDEERMRLKRILQSNRR